MGSPFTLVRWTDHKDTEIHKQRLFSLKQSGLEALELNGTINRFERGSLNQLQKKQKTIQIYPKAPTPLATKVTAKDTCEGADSMTTRLCEGFIRGYRLDSSLQKKNHAYVEYCAVLSSTNYVAGTVLRNGLSQVFMQLCTPNKASYVQHAKVCQCSNCCDVLYVLSLFVCDY